MEPNTLIYALNEFIVYIYKIILIIDTVFTILNISSIIKFQGLVARKPYLCKNIPYLVCYLDKYGLLGTFVNSSCDIKIIYSHNCCIKSVVKGLSSSAPEILVV